MAEEKSAFLAPDYPSIIVSKLIDDVIMAAIESFINSDDKLRWLKLYHVIPELNIEEIDKILYQKKQESIELEAKVEAEFEDQSDTDD